MSHTKDAATATQELEKAGGADDTRAAYAPREDNGCCCAPYCTCRTASPEQRPASSRPRSANARPGVAEMGRVRSSSYRCCDYCMPERGDLAETELQERRLRVQCAKAQERARWQRLADAAEAARVPCGAYRRNTSELLRARRNAQYRRCLDAEYYARRRALQDELACRRDELSHLRRTQPLTQSDYRDPYGELYRCGPAMAAHTARHKVWPCTAHEARHKQGRQEQACQTVTRGDAATGHEALRPPTPCPCHCHRRVAAAADADSKTPAAADDGAVRDESPAKHFQSSLRERNTHTPRPGEPPTPQPPSSRQTTVHESRYPAWPSCVLQSPRFGRKVFITDEEYLRRRSQYLTAWEEAGMVRRVCDTPPRGAGAEGKEVPLPQRTPKWRTLPRTSQDRQYGLDT